LRKKAAIWNSLPGIEEFYTIFHQKIDELITINPEMRILDFGCGTGLLGFQFIPKVKKVAFLDVCPEMIDVVNQTIKDKQIGNAEVFLNDIREISVDPFDLVLALFSFHHVVEQKETLVSIFEKIKQDGKIIICEVKPPLNHENHNNKENNEKIVLPPHMIGEKNIMDLLKEIGFVNVRIEEISFPPSPDPEYSNVCLDSYVVYGERRGK
jgi:cyclopropane fatty-acyl-phospholipid synthase-like methyltransferase